MRKLPRIINVISKRKLFAVILLVVCVLWDTKISYLIPEPFYTDNYPIFNEFGAIIHYVIIALLFVKSCVWTKVIMATIFANSLLNISSVIWNISNAPYYAAANWLFIAIAVFSLIMIIYPRCEK